MKFLLTPILILGLATLSFAQDRSDFREAFSLVYYGYLDSAEFEQKRLSLIASGRTELVVELLDANRLYEQAVEEVILERERKANEPAPVFNYFKETKEYKDFLNWIDDLDNLKEQVKKAERRVKLTKTTYNLCVFDGSSNCVSEYNIYDASINAYNRLVEKFNTRLVGFEEKQREMNLKLKQNGVELQEYREKLKSTSEETPLEKKRDRYEIEMYAKMVQIRDLIAAQEKRDKVEVFNEQISGREPILASIKEHFSTGYDQDACYDDIKNFLAFFDTLDLEELGILTVVMNNGKDISFQKHQKHILVIGHETYQRRKINYFAFYDGDFFYDCDLLPNGKIKKVGKKKYRDDWYNEDHALKNFVRYDEEGNVKNILNQEGDKVIGKRFFHENGSIARISSYENGKLDGMSTWYYDSGEVNATCNYENGKREGDYTVFRKNGKVRGIRPYADGKLHGITKWIYPNDVVVTVLRYEEGKLAEILETNDMDGNPVDKGTFKGGKGTRIVYNSDDGSIKRIDEYKDGEVVKKD